MVSHIQHDWMGFAPEERGDTNTIQIVRAVCKLDNIEHVRRTIENKTTTQSGKASLGDLISRAYIEQRSLGWNVLFRGFWPISWRHAQEYEFAASPYHRGFQDNG
jgi:hypothetical protein